MIDVWGRPDPPGWEPLHIKRGAFLFCSHFSFQLTYSKWITFPHEGALRMVQYLLRDKRVVDHRVAFHFAEAAVFDTVGDLILL